MATDSPTRGHNRPSKIKQGCCRQVCVRGKAKERTSFPMRSPFCFLFLASVLCLAATAPAQDIRIPLPKKSKYTPVQQLNRDGVHALEKHDIGKAKGLFYKAYLIDPNDPFTLN